MSDFWARASSRLAQGMNSIEMTHRDDVPWWEAPIPRRLHRCSAQTTGWRNILDLVERCACGGIRFDGHGRWLDRNSRVQSDSSS